MYRTLIFLALLIALSSTGNSQSRLWTPVERADISSSGIQRIHAEHYQLYQLDTRGLRTLLDQAPMESSSARESTFTIDLPWPDGAFHTVSLVESPVMAARMQQKHPDVKTYTGYRLDARHELVKLDLTPQGFHTMVLAGDSTFFIDPLLQGNPEYHICYYKKDFLMDADSSFICHVNSEILPSVNQPSSRGGGNPTGTDLRTYRLALSTTGEYAQFHGGTVPLVVSAIATSLNRINGIFERDVTLRMILVPNNDTLIYTDPNTDPFTNNSLGAMLSENHDLLDSLIGHSNYDIGHVYGTAGGGVAGGRTCTFWKAGEQQVFPTL